MEAEAMQLYDDRQVHDRLKNQLEGTMGTFRFIGQIVNMYLPKMVDTVVILSGGDTLPPDNPPSEELPPPDVPPLAPPQEPEGPAPIDQQPPR